MASATDAAVGAASPSHAAVASPPTVAVARAAGSRTTTTGTRKSRAQLSVLETAYDRTKRPSVDEIRLVATKAGLSTTAVSRWFRNRRHRTRGASGSSGGGGAPEPEVGEDASSSPVADPPSPSRTIGSLHDHDRDRAHDRSRGRPEPDEESRTSTNPAGGSTLGVQRPLPRRSGPGNEAGAASAAAQATADAGDGAPPPAPSRLARNGADPEAGTDVALAWEHLRRVFVTGSPSSHPASASNARLQLPFVEMLRQNQAGGAAAGAAPFTPILRSHGRPGEGRNDDAIWQSREPVDPQLLDGLRRMFQQHRAYLLALAPDVMVVPVRVSAATKPVLFAGPDPSGRDGPPPSDAPSFGMVLPAPAAAAAPIPDAVYAQPSFYYRDGRDYFAAAQAANAVAPAAPPTGYAPPSWGQQVAAYATYRPPSPHLPAETAYHGHTYPPYQRDTEPRPYRSGTPLSDGS